MYKIELGNDLSSIRFATKALTTNRQDKRPFVNHIAILPYYGGLMAAGCNGSKLYCGTLFDNYEIGLYEVVKNTKKEVVINKAEFDDYPDVYGLFNNEGESFESEHFETGLTKIIRALPENETIDPQYVKECYDFDLYTITVNGEKPIVMTNCTLTGVIAPIRMK